MASTHWPERTMQPQPWSLVKPWACTGRWLRTWVMSDRPAEPGIERGIGANSQRYVIHMRDSKSSRKARGHVSWASFGSSPVVVVADVAVGGGGGGDAGVGDAGDVFGDVGDVSDVGGGAVVGGGALLLLLLLLLSGGADGGGGRGRAGAEGYSRPRSQMEFMRSVFLGSGSQR